MSTIWNLNEFKNINYFLRRTNLIIDDNGNIITNNKNTSDEFKTILNKEIDEIKRLFFLQDKNEILKLLNNSKKVKTLFENDPNNKLYYGLISTIARINPDDASEIFTIFKEIISQYLKIINDLARIMENNFKEPELLKERIDKITNSTIETNEEKYVKNHINYILEHTKDITDSFIFKPTIDKYNKNIKELIIKKLVKKYGDMVKRKIFEETVDISGYKSDKVKNISRKKGKIPKDIRRG